MDRKGEKMKKKILIGSILALLLSFFVPNLVYASTKFKEGEYIPNLWINKEKNGRIRYQQARFLRRQDGQFVYCIEPWAEVDEGVTYEDAIDIHSLKEETLNKIALIAYYGYQYGNHTDSKWYYITQVLIWQEVDKEADFYFTDQLNGNRTNQYDTEMKEIKDLVKAHQTLPNFNQTKLTLALGESITLNDLNRVLADYQVISNTSHIKIEKKENTLKITTKSVGKETITLQKKDQRFDTPPIIYRHPEKQDFLSIGSYEELKLSIPIEIKGGEIKVKKIDQDTKTNQAQGDAELKGSIFDLYDEKNNLIQSVTLDESLEASFKNLKIGTYILKERTSGIGYLLNDKTITITLTKSKQQQTVLFENKVIENKIKIIKFYGTEEKGWKKEEAITFGFYNQKGEKVFEETTDQNGELEITLPYGTYTVKQLNGPDNYEKVEDFIIQVTEDKKEQIFYKFNQEKQGTGILYKIDQATKERIKEKNITFLLKEKETGKVIGTYKTDKEGCLTIENLSYGTYLLEEQMAPTGYLLNTEPFEFTIDDNHRQVIIYFENQKLEEHTVEVPDTGLEEEDQSIHVQISISNTPWSTPNTIVNNEQYRRKKRK